MLRAPRFCGYPTYSFMRLRDELVHWNSWFWCSFETAHPANAKRLNWPCAHLKWFPIRDGLRACKVRRVSVLFNGLGWELDWEAAGVRQLESQERKRVLFNGFQRPLRRALYSQLGCGKETRGHGGLLVSRPCPNLASVWSRVNRAAEYKKR